MIPDPEKSRIGGGQLLTLLAACRMFTIMIYSPGKSALPGAVTFAVQLPALALELLLLVPAFRAEKRCGSDLLRCAANRPVTRRAAGVLCLFFTLTQTARTLTVQTDFLTGTIYREPSRWGILAALAAGILYMAHLGLESFARFSGGILVLFAAMTAGVALQILPRVDLLSFHSPLEQGFPGLLRGTAFAVARCGELGAAVLLLPAVREKAFRRTAAAGALWTGITALTAFLTLTVLGNYAALRTYPVYALALAGSERSVFSRMDAVMLTVWIFLAMLRGALYLWLSCRTVALLTRKGEAFCLCAAGAGVLFCLLWAQWMPGLWSGQLLWGAGLFAVTLVLPLLAVLGKRGETLP